jgi:signal transduction histidine kinase
MKLVRRLTLMLLAAVTVVFALDTWLSVRSHLELFAEDTRRDEALFAHVLGRAVEQVWRASGERDARELVASIAAASPDIQARVIPIDEAMLGKGSGSPRTPQQQWLSQAKPRRLETTAALDVPSRTPVALQISESLSQEHEYALARVRQAVGTTLAAVLACGAVAWLVGVRVVGRPIEALVAKARRIARNDFSAPLSLRPETELAMLAREMNDMAASLDHAAREIQEQSAARAAALEQLRHADRLTTVGKLASGLAHELGTPLNVVSGRARMILSGEAAEPAEVTECARVIAAQADRMTELVRGLLGFARRRSGEKVPIDVAALVRQTVALLVPLAAKRGVEIDSELPDTAVSVHADAPQLQQAFMNLIMNGVQASAAGQTVHVGVSLARDGAPKGVVEAGPFAVVAVRDEGPGIPADQLEQVFDPFFTTKPPGEGTGLGLAVAYGIAQDHAGWIDVQSESGRGSCFRVGLPVARS